MALAEVSSYLHLQACAAGAPGRKLLLPLALGTATFASHRDAPLQGAVSLKRGNQLGLRCPLTGLCVQKSGGGQRGRRWTQGRLEATAAPRPAAAAGHVRLRTRHRLRQ